MADPHKDASMKVLDALTEGMKEGNLADLSGSGMILSFVCIVEMLDSEGRNRIATLWNDERSTVLLGLLNYGHMQVQGGMGGQPE